MRSKNLMANLRRSKDVGGRRSKPDEGCKRHPRHRQSPGVCSLCLGEKLSQLSAHSSSRRYKTNPTVASSNYSSSSSSSLSSHCSSASSSSSPMHRYRFTTDQRKCTSFPLLLFSGKCLLTKSRSVAFASNIRSKEGNDKKKNGGFLSKLLHPGKNTKMKEETIIKPTGLLHSWMTREISTTRVH